MWGKTINYSCVVLFPRLSRGRRERSEVTEKQGGDRKKRWIRGEKSNAEEYFIKVAFITTAFMWCLFSCHSSISPSSPSLSLFFHSAFLNASSRSLSLCHFSISSQAISHFLCASVLWSFLHLSLFISVVRLLCEGLQWPLVREEIGIGERRQSNHHDVVFHSTNSPSEAK